MKKLMFVLLLSTLGCDKANKITGGDSDSDGSTYGGQNYGLITIACCMDANGGVPQYPPFLPASHVQVCQAARQKLHDNTPPDDGIVRLPVGRDCGHGKHDIGDEYYPSTGY